MNDIPKYKEFKKIVPINKGWSSDKKYYIETIDGTKLLLRLSDISEYEKKKAEYDAVKKASNIGLRMSKPIDFGKCNQDKNVYMLLSWIDGEDAETLLPTLSHPQQYELGIQAGQLLYQIHSLPAPDNAKPWETRFNNKMDRKIKMYRQCGIKINGDEKIIEYMDKNRHLFHNRPQCFHHGDYHVGNLIVTPKTEIAVIDFNRFDYGDPWEEFSRIVWCSSCSKYFASGRIDGYFGDHVPDEFFKLLALYIASNTLSSIYWAIPFGEREVNTMINQAKEILDFFDGMSNPVPKWYGKGGKI